MPSLFRQPSRFKLVSPFLQNKLPYHQPVWTPRLVSSIFLLIGFLFLVIALVTNLVEVLYVKKYDLRYDDLCNYPVDPNSYEPCTVTLNIQQDIPGPVYFYYHLHHFYQNHRRYSKSVSPDQLRGTQPSVGTLGGECYPLSAYWNNSQTLTSPTHPCGLIYDTFFTDTFSMELQGGAAVDWESSGIAWWTDRLWRFSSDFAPDKAVDTPEDVMVWMRTAGLPHFSKLYRKIPGTLAAGIYDIHINNSFPVSSFSGQKWFMVSNMSWFGGKNKFIWISYYIVGGTSVILSSLLFILSFLRPPRFRKKLVGNAPGLLDSSISDETSTYMDD